MNYRHGYHAGNFADVLKHVALVAILAHVKKKDKGFSVIDSHAGRGLYDLRDAQAQATGEAAGGIEQLEGLRGALPEALKTYLTLVGEVGRHRYPGSPLIAAKLLRDQDRLTAIEKHPEEVAILKDVLAPFSQATAEQGDGYARLIKLLPPPSRRGLAIIDPPFKSPDEFAALADSLRAAIRKFATGIYLVWYPLKSRSAAGGFLGEMLAAGIAKALTIEIAVAPDGDRMTRAGLLVINPPFGFAGEMAAIAQVLAPRLGRPADIRIDWLAGAE